MTIYSNIPYVWIQHSCLASMLLFCFFALDLRAIVYKKAVVYKGL